MSATWFGEYEVPCAAAARGRKCARNCGLVSRPSTASTTPASAAGTYTGPSRYRCVTTWPPGLALLTSCKVTPNARDNSPRVPATLTRRVAGWTAVTAAS